MPNERAKSYEGLERIQTKKELMNQINKPVIRLQKCTWYISNWRKKIPKLIPCTYPYLAIGLWNHQLILFLLCSIFLLSCQENNNEKTIQIIKAIQKKNQTIRTDSSFIELKQAEKLIQKTQAIPDSIKAENDYLLGLCYRRKGNLDSASIYFHNATEYVQTNIKSRRQEDYFYEAWDSYFDQEKYGDCLTISETFKSKLDENKDYARLALAYYFYENVYKRREDYTKALDYNRLRIEMLEKKNDLKNFKPAALISQAQIHYEKGDKKRAMETLEQLLKQTDNLSDMTQRQLYTNYGIYLFWDKKYNESISLYNKQLKAIRRMKPSSNTKSYLANSFSNIAGSYIELGEYKKAQAYLDSVKVLDINTIGTRAKDSYLIYQLIVVAKTDQNIGVVISALDSIREFQKEDYKIKNETELVALKKSHEKEKKLQQEKQEADLEKLKYKSVIGALFFLIPILSIAIYYFIRQRKYKYEQQNLQMQQRLLRSQMNPHFIFNFLYAIQNQIKEKPKSAINYLVKFSRLLRLTLENSMVDYVRLDKELESLTKYMDLQLLRFPNRFNYEITIDGLEEEEIIFIPPMLLQPIVENCIEHGFTDINHQGEIKIFLDVKDKFIACIVEDNGVGLQSNIKSEKKSRSIRLISDFLKKTTSKDIEIINKGDLPNQGTGVRVKFLIPFKFSGND